jgi:hypothetical protein
MEAYKSIGLVWGSWRKSVSDKNVGEESGTRGNYSSKAPELDGWICSHPGRKSKKNRMMAPLTGNII